MEHSTASTTAPNPSSTTVTTTTSSSSAQTLVNLPADCAFTIASYLRGNEPVVLSEACRDAVKVYRPYTPTILIDQCKVPAAIGDEAQLRTELSAVLPKLPDVTGASITAEEQPAPSIARAGLEALEEAGACRRLRRLTLVLTKLSPGGACEVLFALGALMGGAGLSSLEELNVNLSITWREQQQQEGGALPLAPLLLQSQQPPRKEDVQAVRTAYAAFFSALGEANAAPRLARLRVEGTEIGEEGAAALAEAIEARHARSLAPLIELDAPDWLEYPSAAQRILRVCLPTLRGIRYDGYCTRKDVGITTLAQALRTIPAPQLEELELAGAGHDASPLAAVLRHVVFPRLTFLSIVFNVGDAGLRDLAEALRHNLQGLEIPELIVASSQDENGVELLAPAFAQEGGWARLKMLRFLAVTLEKNSSFDEAMAAAIAKGACPVLADVKCRMGKNGAAERALAARRGARG